MVNKIKAQSTIEACVSFIVLILLFGAIFKLWIWGNAQLVSRQKAYNDSRLDAGKSSRSYKLEWPVDNSVPPMGDAIFVK